MCNLYSMGSLHYKLEIGVIGKRLPFGYWASLNKRWILPLAALLRSLHNMRMAGNHPFKIKIEQDPESERRFLWIIYEGARLRERSPQSYATIRHAKADAERVMQRLITTSQSNK